MLKKQEYMRNKEGFSPAVGRCSSSLPFQGILSCLRSCPVGVLWGYCMNTNNIWFLKDHSESCARIQTTKWDSRHSQFGGLRVLPLPLCASVILLASSGWDLQQALGGLAGWEAGTWSPLSLYVEWDCVQQKLRLNSAASHRISCLIPCRIFSK